MPPEGGFSLRGFVPYFQGQGSE
ncbi:TPA_asm: hypothetical protein, partial [ssRNA phage SRR5466338_3]